MHFLRTGDARALLGVIEHNAWDVVAMAALVGVYGEPLDASTSPLGDLVGVARTLARAGKPEQAFEVASRAVEAGDGGRAHALRARAEIRRRVVTGRAPWPTSRPSPRRWTTRPSL